jgi:uncharacterized sulfatase
MKVCLRAAEWTVVAALFVIVSAQGRGEQAASATDRASPTVPAHRPFNILFAIADDWSWPYASAYGCRFVNTPAFDRVAREGVLFNNAFCASPGCSPSRASILTGRPTWQLEHAGTHDSAFSSRLAVYPDILEAAGYQVGFTGKGWGPGNFQAGGRIRNPAGPAYDQKKLPDKPNAGIHVDDYAGNFADFLARKAKDQPFCFWYGCKEPHRSYEKGTGLKAGKKLEDVEVPPYLPDVPEVRSDLLDYAIEIEWFDRHLGQILAMLDEAHELDNTVVIVASDNGMPFPRAKANLYEYGTHMPLAIRWPGNVPRGKVLDDFVSHIDLAPTILQAANLEPPATMVGRSLVPLIASTSSGQVDPTRNRVFMARERHSSARVDNLGYPSRALRTAEFLYVRNFAPDRWPAGDPRGAGDDEFGYYDIDGSPTKTLLIMRHDEPPYDRFFHLAMDKRPPEELFDLKTDPGTVVNVADRPEYAGALKRLRAEMDEWLKATGDPRVSGNGDIFETYPRYSPIRKFE